MDSVKPGAESERMTTAEKSKDAGSIAITNASFS